ncbi:MAG: hypothetical protein ACKVHO_24195, partial [Verrucomicrobiia bacterium]
SQRILGRGGGENCGQRTRSLSGIRRCVLDHQIVQWGDEVDFSAVRALNLTPSMLGGYAEG